MANKGKGQWVGFSMQEGKERLAFKPLAFVLIFLVFVALFFTIALTDAGRMTDILLDSLVSNGYSIIEVVEGEARDKYSLLTAHEYPPAETPAGFIGMDDRFSLRESLVWSLADTAREIDRKQEAGLLSPEALATLAAGERLQAIGIFDASGHEIARSGQIPEAALHQAGPLLKGTGDIVMDLFDDAGKRAPAGLVGLRRRQGRGAVLLILDGEGLRYWSSRIVIQQAIQESGLKKEVVYFVVMDPSGRWLAGVGELPSSQEKKTALKEALPDSAGNTTGRRLVFSESAGVLEIEAPLRIDGVIVGTARIGLDTGRIDELSHSNRRHLFLSTGLLMALGLLATGLIYRTQNRSLSRLAHLREMLQRSEQLSSLGQLAAGVAHEIRNPLNAISMAAQRLAREYSGAVREKEEFLHLTGVIRDEISRLNRIIEEFLGLSRRRLALSPGSIVSLLESVIHLMGDDAAARHILIEHRWEASDALVFMDQDKMKQALLNITANAMEALGGGGRILFSTEKSGKDQLAVSVQDTGPGMDSDQLKQIFNPHFSTKEKGLGIGLAIAYEIVRAHGGEIRVSSEPGRGTVFQLLLPLERKPREEP